MKTSVCLVAAVCSAGVFASETTFSVHDDVLAFPQYELVFSESYITVEHAQRKLDHPDSRAQASESRDGSHIEDLALFRAQDDQHDFGNDAPVSEAADYEYVVKSGRPYLCTIPLVESQTQNATETTISQEDQDKEVARAVSKGWELLQDMKGKPCLFYTTGWWSYSFCYDSQVKQFHSLPPGVNGAPLWPPTEDPTTPAYVLGKFDPKTSTRSSSDGTPASSDMVELQKKAETSYLVQRLDGGTECDLTGLGRKIDVQFHCNPQTTDRIGWIKETATCSYLMVIYTPRLCNDVAFLPPKESSAHPITCQEILGPDEIDEWKARKVQEAQRKFIAHPDSDRVTVGNIEVGGMNHIGRDGKKIERGRVVMTREERAEVIAMQKDGRFEGLSKADLKKLDLNPEEIETFRKEMQKLAAGKDWKIERLDDVNGHIQLRGIVATDKDDTNVEKEEDTTGEEVEEGDRGSEETFREDI